eukprot:m.103845 g.103845  ORF g.103845 m.103845 type:complete len:85 (-) comp12624_c1_seq1:1825-2079(-)
MSMCTNIASELLEEVHLGLHTRNPLGLFQRALHASLQIRSVLRVKADGDDLSFTVLCSEGEEIVSSLYFLQPTHFNESNSILSG